MGRFLRFFIAIALMIGIVIPHSASIEAATTETAIVNVSSVLNVREKALSNSKKVGTLKKGAKVTVYSKSKSGWSEIRFKSKKAYVSTKYLKFSAPVKKTSINKFAKTSFQTTANLNMRSGAGAKDRIVLMIPKGKKVTSTEKTGNTYKVSYTYQSKGKNVTKTGWVSGKYLKEYYTYTNTGGTYFLTKKTANLYTSADTKKNAVSKVSIGNVLYSTQKAVNSLGQTWYRVSFNGKNLYVNSGDVSKDTLKSFSQTTYKAKKDTSLYASHGNAYKNLLKIPKGTIVSSKQRVNYWYKVSFNGNSGYIQIADFTKQAVSTDKKMTEEKLAKDTMIVVTDINVRKTADVAAPSLTTIPKDVFVFPTHKSANGWYKVVVNGKTGYVLGEEVITGDPMNNRSGYQFIDLRTQSPVTAAQIDQYIANYVKATGKRSVLTGKGKEFIEVGKKRGVNALYLAAHAIHESAFGTSQISLGKLNLFGFGAYDATPYIGAYRFSNINSSIDYIAREMKSTYLNPNNWKYHGAYLGFSTKTSGNARVDALSEGMNFYYATDPDWGQKIASHMEKMLPFNKSHYNKAAVHTGVPAQPSVPVGSDLFPKDIVAIAKTEIRYGQKGKITQNSPKIKKGTKFTLLEKTNDYWVKVKIGSKVYWTNDIKFHEYTKFVSVQNLGRVNEDLLNIRQEPNTTSKSLAKLGLNQYVQIVLKKDGTLTMDKTKKWYQIKLSNGKTGWVSAQYITRELK
ncbi:SH3 domain-containing protein [Lederbergia citrea]|uniref:SH3 domain-containing protein n=1 Tax=Lederbergia citrea TaxID=2833581 RepID=UPI001BCA0C74|nr:SH3 domain-containing protein [Lederbergia citrea]MBS4178180.1 SH3 domain-containing protein [Lederbergia citrea]